MPPKTAVSTAFRQQVGKVITNITFFIIVYLLLVLAAIALAIGCCWAGVAMIIAMPRWITLMLGLGLMALGLSVIIFLVKFMFAVAKDENPHRVEIKEADQPRLFAVIRQLTQETQTPFPKKIYLSPDVNACVFYNSSFWSMLLPIRKNLEIGLGLVNSVNVSEFKAVMAHEFGHFSQRSMKLGSFTYNVNRIIHNMLYDNTSYGRFLSSWASINSYLAFFANITVKIAEAIQWLLRVMYRLVNKSYLGLSREMEFHADAVAASVTGGNNLVTALSRTEVAGSCYNLTLQYANKMFQEKKIANNLFPLQRTVFHDLAADHGLPVRQGLPDISHQFIESYSRSRINYKDQWASHPTLAERRTHLESLGIHMAPDESPAWVLFDHPEKLQETLTEKLYGQVQLPENMVTIDTDAIASYYSNHKDQHTLPAAYKGYYDGRHLSFEDWDPATATAQEETIPASFDEIYNEETSQWPSAISSTESDIELAKAIRDKKIDVSSFDFDGIKYLAKDAGNVVTLLEKDLETLKEKLKHQDRKAFFFFLAYSSRPGSIRNAYADFKALNQEYEEYVGKVNQLMGAIEPLRSGQGLTLENVNSVIGRIRSEVEPPLKKAYGYFLEKGIVDDSSTNDLARRLREFCEKDYHYFVGNQFQDNELNELTGLATETAGIVWDRKRKAYRELLELQLSLMN